MKKIFFLVFMLSIGIGLNAARFIEPGLAPVWWSLKSDKPMVEPLENVYVHFQYPIKLMDSQAVDVICEGKIVAESVSADVLNDKASTGWAGTLVIHFDKQCLPKGKSYKLHIPQGVVGWTESYNDIQVVNMEVDMGFSVPENLGEPEIYASTQISDSNWVAGISYLYETVAAEDACFELYREGEKIGECPLDIMNYEIPLSQIYPAFEEYIIFEQHVRYSLVLPAGSVSSIYRDDIVNEEVRMDFVGCYVDPSLPFSYIWCSWYTDHSDVLGEVSFTYDRAIALTENAKVQLWEGPDCETLVKEVTPRINTDVNCWLLEADFGGVPLTSEKGYSLVIPDGALISVNEIGVQSGRSQLSIPGSAGVGSLLADPSQSDAPIYDVYGRRVRTLLPGSIYIQNGRKFIQK